MFSILDIFVLDVLSFNSCGFKLYCLDILNLDVLTHIGFGVTRVFERFRVICEMETVGKLRIYFAGSTS